VGELVPPFHHAAQFNHRQVAELGLSDARVTDDRNVKIGHFKTLFLNTVGVVAAGFNFSALLASKALVL